MFSFFNVQGSHYNLPVPPSIFLWPDTLWTWMEQFSQENLLELPWHNLQLFGPCPCCEKENALGMGELHGNDAKRTRKRTFKLGFRTMEVGWIGSIVFFWGTFESESAMLSSNLLFIEIILFLNSKFTQSIFSQNSVRSQWLIEFHKSRYGEVTLISSSEDFYLLVLLKSPSHVILISILLICNPKNYFNVKK